MDFWIETGLKAIALLASLTLGLAATFLFLIGTLGNGNATTTEPFSWTGQAIWTSLWAIILAAAWFGCRGAWRGIDRWMRSDW